MIQAKIAKVLSEDEFVINKGQFDGVERGMIFEVKDERLDDIIDPDTNESLGSIDRPIVSMRITRVGERAALGRRYERSGGWGIAGSGLDRRPLGILTGRSEDEVVEVGDPAIWNGEMFRRLYPR